MKQVLTVNRFSATIVLALLVTVVAIFGFGCSSKVVRHEVSEVRADSAGVRAAVVEEATAEFKPVNRRAYEYYITGVLYDQIRDPYNASRMYERALKFYPESYEIRTAYADAQYRLGKAKDALKTLDKVEPRDADVLRLEAKCYHRLNMADSVRSAYLQIVDRDPDDSFAFSFLAGLYRQEQDLDSTIWAYENIVRLRPDNYRHLNELAKLQAQKGNLAEAADTFRRSIDVEASAANILAVAGLGEVYRIMERDDSAAAVFERGLEYDPGSLVLHRQLASIYVEQDSLLAALPHVRSIAELSPDDDAAHRRLGAIYFAVDSVEQAGDIFSDLVDDGDHNPINHYYLGRIAAMNENWSDARDEFTLLTQYEDTSDANWLMLGSTYRQMGDHEGEIRTYLNGLNHMESEDAAINLYFALGAAYEQAGQYQKAEETFEEIIAHRPEHAQALNYLGYMLADRGERLQYAKELIQRAVKLKPNNAAFLDSYGWVYYQLGQYEQALEYLKQAVELDIDPVIFDHLGDTYHALGQTEQAREWWEKALEQQPDNEKIREKLGR